MADVSDCVRKSVELVAPICEVESKVSFYEDPPVLVPSGWQISTESTPPKGLVTFGEYLRHLRKRRKITDQFKRHIENESIQL
jgi:hypothetical protein